MPDHTSDIFRWQPNLQQMSFCLTEVRTEQLLYSHPHPSLRLESVLAQGKSWIGNVICPSRLATRTFILPIVSFTKDHPSAPPRAAQTLRESCGIDHFVCTRQAGVRQQCSGWLW